MAKLCEVRQSVAPAAAIYTPSVHEKPRDHHDHHHDDPHKATLATGPRSHPLDGTIGLLSRTTLHWIQPLLRRGFRTPLQENDVWRLPRGDRLSSLRPRFESVWVETATTPASVSSSSSNTNSTATTAMKRRLARALAYAAWKPLRLALLTFSTSATLAMLQPLVIKALLLQLSQPVDENTTSTTTTSGKYLSNPYVLAALLGLVSFSGTTAFNLGLFSAVRSGSNARLVLLDAVYRRLLLQTTNSSSTSTSVGDVLTLTSVDCERVLDAFAIGAWLVLSPLMLLALCVLIGVQLGVYVALAALGTVVVIVSLVLATSLSMGRYRQQIARASSQRVQLLSETLQGIRVLKCYGWEQVCAARIEAIRAQEVEYLRRFAALRVYNSVIVSLAPLLVSAVCFTVVALLRTSTTSSGGEPLDVATAFAVVALANATKTPLSIFGDASIAVSEAHTALQRLGSFLTGTNAPPLSPLGQEEKTQEDGVVLAIQDADFHWPSSTGVASASAPTPVLCGISITIRRAELTIVVGGVGAGKTSLVNAMLGLMMQSRGSRALPSRNPHVAFASQQPWLQHATLRDNILFGEPLDETTYARVLAACQLAVDVTALDAGDATEIGERGSNLSGGQRARIALARAIYRVCIHGSSIISSSSSSATDSLLVMDDPLSALDVHVANAVFHEAIVDLTSNCARVLVLNTHYHLLDHADRVVVLGDDGRIVAEGTLAQVRAHVPSLATAAALDSIAIAGELAPTPRQNGLTSHPIQKISTPKTTITSPPSSPLMVEEDRAKGSLGAAVYLQYIGFCGWNAQAAAVSICTLFLSSQVALFLCDWMLSQWTSPHSRIRATTPATAVLGIYLALVAAAVALVVLRCRWFTEICMRCSTNLHARLVANVLRAPVPTFFDVTPMGRILNRFSRDLDNVDGPLPYVSLWALVYFFQIAAALVVCGATNPLILGLCVPLVVVFRRVAQFFQRAARELKRLDGVTRSPFVNQVGETLAGLATIRLHGKASHFQSKCERVLDHNASFALAYQASMWWFAMRTDWLVAAIIMAVAMLCSAMRGGSGSGSGDGDGDGSAMAALALTYAAQLTSSFQRATVLATQTENVMTSFERIAHYESIRSEEEHARAHYQAATTDPETPAPTPVDGAAIVFENVSMRYRPELELVLQNVSFQVQSGEKVGVCGRTGSGKSSLMSLLFRVVECTSGRVCIDGVDIATLPLQALRAKLTIIPQDPMLFSGSLRLNLDPFHEKDDAQLWDVLRKVHLYDVVTKWGQGLEYDVAEKGDNLSVGQRQLLCIARALIRESKVVVMDEATANVDQESDKLIQLTVRESFAGRDTTVLCIAHRLETIIHSDKILVLDGGKVIEFDSPEQLMQKKDGVFQSLVESSRATTVAAAGQ